MNYDEILATSMAMITEAGDARVVIGEALTAMEQGTFEVADSKIALARKLIAKAHSKQTALIQGEEEGNVQAYPLLFSHAQDTLMTINSELNLCKKLRGIFFSIDKRLTALESI